MPNDMEKHAAGAAHSNDSAENSSEKDIGKKDTPALSPQATRKDGGMAAWLTILGCSLAFFASFGFVTSFGVFQSYYESALPNTSASSISWIGSFQLWCITGMAIPSVILNCHLGPRATLAIGSFLTVFGVMMASLADRYYQFLLAHGVCAGVGIGLTFLPIVGLPNQWFDKRRGLAVGLAIGGSSVGGVIWPIIIDRLLNHDKIGYPWTMRTVGFVQLAVMCAAIALIRNNVPRNTAVTFRSFPFVAALKQVGIDLMGVGLLLHFLGVYVPYFYAPPYAQALGASSSTAFNVSAVLNAATFVGRLVMGMVADSLGPSNTLIFCVAVSGLLNFAWQGVTSAPALFVWVVIYGWFSGASISLQSPAMIGLVPGRKVQLIGPYIAILCELSSLGNLAGNPIAGALLHQRSAANNSSLSPHQADNFHPMMWFAGSVLLGSTLFYQAARHTYSPKFIAKA